MYSVYFLHYADYKSTTMYTCTCPSENGEGEGFEALTNIDFDYGNSHLKSITPLPTF